MQLACKPLRQPVTNSFGLHAKVFQGGNAVRSDSEETTNNLIGLGPGDGSKVEHIKVKSRNLRGQIAEELAQDTTHFSEEQVHLIKFHGIYQQEDRDARRDARQTKSVGAEKAYQFMIRSRIPGGVLTAEQYLA